MLHMVTRGRLLSPESTLVPLPFTALLWLPPHSVSSPVSHKALRNLTSHPTLPSPPAQSASLAQLYVPPTSWLFLLHSTGPWHLLCLQLSSGSLSPPPGLCSNSSPSVRPSLITIPKIAKHFCFLFLFNYLPGLDKDKMQDTELNLICRSMTNNLAV